ncbi:LysM peptidoglycan-binding domain-containing protein [Mycetocola reblochoni]|nr:LysM peptidoglycan-binding domain-containing protein [Mycetocola reblochoni]RLP68158.1 LysM peptidoglycan-binding domain-containing protein [Mycetocola reblochoni]
MTAQLIGSENRGTQGRPVISFAAPSPSAFDARTRLRITARGRAVIAILVVVPLLALGLLWGASTALASSTASGVAFDYVTVQQGDTLWGIVSDFPRAQDPRDSVAEFINLNNLATAELQPGQRLAVPASLSAAQG